MQRRKLFQENLNEIQRNSDNIMTLRLYIQNLLEFYIKYSLFDIFSLHEDFLEKPIKILIIYLHPSLNHSRSNIHNNI